MRNVTFDPKNAKIDVDTVFVDNVDGLDTDGKSFPDYMKNFFHRYDKGSFVGNGL